jgi:threonine/homoserine/homoserine lactone efflux protein
MMLDLFAIGFFAGLALAIPVGPMAIMLMNTTIERGIRHGAIGALAMATVDFSYAFTVFALGQIIANLLSDFGLWLSLGGAAILLVLGLQTLIRNLRLFGAGENALAAQTSTGSRGLTFTKFAGATILNPPTALYFLAIAPSLKIGSAGNAATSIDTSLLHWALIFAIGVFVGSVIWQQGLALAGLGLRQITSNRVRPWIGSIGGLLIIGLAVKIAIDAF